MACRLRSFAPFLLLVLSAAVAGCGKTQTAGPSASREQKMTEIGRMYKEYTADHRQPPRKLSDFDHPYEPGNIDGYAALRDGECVMLWGGSLPGAGAGATVLAYEKAVPEQGGLVVFQDGTVKELTADEFKAAPKVK